MIPITKNITVVDENGNTLTNTFIKRAKGLVKKGRARFVNDDTICLTCPPNEFLEDIIMTDNLNKTVEKEPEANTNIKTDLPELSIEYVLKQIEKIVDDTSHIKKVLDSISINATGSTVLALSDIVKSREATNQNLINFYENIYNNLTAKEAQNELYDKINSTATLETMIASLGNMNDETKANAINNMYSAFEDTKRHLINIIIE